MEWKFIYRIFVCILVLEFDIGWTLELLQSLTGTIGAENYTYYRLARTGRIKVELVSLSGDADLFVSQHTINPTYRNYDAQSITCGTDVVEIPESYSRPVGIGIYGHYSSEISSYRISIYLLPKDRDIDYEHYLRMFQDYEAADFMFTNYEASHYMYKDAKDTPKRSGSNVKQTTNRDSDEEENDGEEETLGSVLWHILLTLLKVIFEVIL